MGTQSPDPKAASPGELWRWDGQQWQRAAPKPYWTRRKLALAAGAWLLTVFGSCGVGAAAASSPKPAPATATATVATAKPTTAPATAMPTVAPATPKPAPQLLNFEGQGATVKQVDLSKGLYKFSWRVEASQFENFAIYLEGSGDKRLLVNELVGSSQFKPNNPSSGDTTVNAGGGRYALEVQTSTTKWWVTFTPL